MTEQLKFLIKQYDKNKLTSNELINEIFLIFKPACEAAISDHYMLAPSHQPYNDEEAKEMINEWITLNFRPIL